MTAQGTDRLRPEVRGCAPERGEFTSVLDGGLDWSEESV